MSLTRRAATAGAMLAVTAVVAACTCDPVGDAWATPAGVAPRAPAPVAIVNRAPITAADLAAAMTAATRGDPHQTGATAATTPARDQVLDQLIDEELAAQRAVALGLDADAALQQELARRQAEVDRFRRQALAGLLERDAREHAAIGEADLRRYFDEHADRIRTVTRVQQILLRDRTAIEAARHELDAGAPFEAVAARQFPELPAGATPWDLGELKWNQLPEPWDGIVDRVAVGDTSPIIEGPRGRLWIVKVVDRRTDPAITFDTARPAIEAVLRDRAATAARAELGRTLRADATIVRTPIDPAASHGP